MMRPTWKKGDVLAMPQNLCPSGSSVNNGCAIFVAQSDPVMFQGNWCYVARDARELRLATREDAERLVKIETENVRRAQRRLAMLMAVVERMKETGAYGADGTA